LVSFISVKLSGGIGHSRGTASTLQGKRECPFNWLEMLSTGAQKEIEGYLSTTGKHSFF